MIEREEKQVGIIDILLAAAIFIPTFIYLAFVA